jgi:hypothetical protein
MEWTAPKPASSPPLLWDWGDHAATGSGSSSDAPARRGGKEREAKRARAGEDRGGGELRCQVEGCGLDLSRVKDYHRKHRVCEAHTKSPRVIVAGQERRFCQQCSRWVVFSLALACLLHASSLACSVRLLPSSFL